MLAMALLCALLRADPLPATPLGALFEDFVGAYNTGDREALEAFVRRRYAAARSPAATADQWRKLFRHYGPVKVHGVRESTPNSLEVWLRGAVTRAWFAVGFRVDHQGRIVARGLLQGLIPEDWRREAIDPARLPSEVEPYLEAMGEQGYFSGAVGLYREGKPLYEGAFGWADREAGRRNEVDTRFSLASVSKVFTTLAVMQLVENDDLGLDEPIVDLVPEYPEDISEQVTVRQLLLHSSGIELDDHPPFREDWAQATSLEEVLAAHVRHMDHLNEGRRADFEPLGRYDYTNEGFDLLALIVERATGQPYLEYLEEHVLGPAGMSHTGPLGDSVARAYAFPEAGGERLPVPFFQRTALGSTGLCSTVADLHRLAVALFQGERLLSAASRREMCREVGSKGTGIAYTLGLELLKTGGVTSVGHNGGTEGVSTEWRYFPATGHLIVVLCNQRRCGVFVARELQSMLLGS